MFSNRRGRASMIAPIKTGNALRRRSEVPSQKGSESIYNRKLASAGKSAEEAARSYGFAGTLGCAGMSVEEAARFLGIGRSLTYGEIKAGRLIARKAGRRTIITRDDALNYLRSLPIIGGPA